MGVPCSGVTKPSLLVSSSHPLLNHTFTRFLFFFSIILFLFLCFSQCQAFDLTTINDSHDSFVFFFVFFLLFSLPSRMFVFAGFIFTNIIQS